MGVSFIFYDATTVPYIIAAYKQVFLSKEHVSSPWRWREIYRNM